jgi:putative nucleotidyltransferase with HDIG domain
MSSADDSRSQHDGLPGAQAVRAPLEIASGQTPRSIKPVGPGDPVFSDVTERRWRARIAAFSGPPVYVPLASPPHAGTLVTMLLRDRAPAVGEVLWARRRLPMAGAAVRYVRRPEGERPDGTGLAGGESAWEALIELKGIPALPEAAADVLRSAGSSLSGAAEVARSIERDAALSRAVVDLANSANFRATEPLKDVRAAVVRLGIERVRLLVLASSVFRLFPPGAESAQQDACDERISFEGLWIHSLTCAIVAEALARLARIPADDAFLAGLFHDIGKFLLARAGGASFSAVLDQVEEWGITLGEAEKAALGFTHARAGAWLLSRWGLRGSIVAAVGSHHGARGGQRNQLAAAAHVGDLIARGLAAGTTWDRRMPQADPTAWRTLGLEPDDTASVIEVVVERLAGGASLFEQAGVRAPFLERAGHATDADPILGEAAEAAAARRRAELFEESASPDAYVARIAHGAARVARAPGAPERDRRS